MAKWLQANGEVERQKRTQITQAERKDFKKELNVYLASYRSLPHPTTGVSYTPAELFWSGKYGHNFQNYEMYALTSKYEIKPLCYLPKPEAE